MYVYPNLIGGIGNQLFILAATIKYAQDSGRTVVFVEEEYNNPHCPNDIPIQKLFPDIQICLNKKQCGLELSNGIFEYVQYPIVNDEIVCISGYNQHYKLIPDNFYAWSKYLPDPNIDLKYHNTCFLHVRRTDYIGLPHLDLNLELYWKRALELVDKSVDILIVSDDMEWANIHIPILDPTRNWVHIEKPLTALETLYVMSKCEKGAICANSTLSWWGAYLNKNRLITMPLPWSYIDKNEELGLYFQGVQPISIS